MPDDPYRTPHPMNVPGDFYVGTGCCLTCEVPTDIAPDLFAIEVEDGCHHCYVTKQPVTAQELDRMVDVLEFQDVFCIRYRGVDPTILARIDSTSCDAPRVQPARRWWQLWRPRGS